MCMLKQRRPRIGIARMLSDDWSVISAHGDVGEGKDVFPSNIRAGVLTRIFNGKPFDVMERVSVGPQFEPAYAWL